MYKNCVLFFLFVSSFVSFGQVGINTISPDPNSILDIVSEDKGVLFPRMTTPQRIDMSDNGNVTHSLTVFDINLNGYYFWDANATNPNTGALEPRWVRLLTQDVVRDNYVIVKRMSDFPAPVGGVIDLIENTLYEINGVVSMTAQLRMNGAYIAGRDSGEDILVNNLSGGNALFIGDSMGESSGSLNTLVLNGNGNPIFELTGTGVEPLFVLNCIISGAAPVGNLNGLGTVFTSVTQFLNNSGGITINSANSFLAQNILWDASNSGTFQTLNGNFGIIAQSGGVIIADTGETGIDVSANPNIFVSGLLSSLTFTGLGTRIEPYDTAPSSDGSAIYPGYNFSSKWAIDCPGIRKESDSEAAVGLGFSGSLSSLPTGANATNSGAVYGGISITFPAGIALNTPLYITGYNNPSNLFRFSYNPALGELTYEGNDSRIFTLSSNISINSSRANDIYEFRFVLNGTVLNNFGAQREDNGTDIDGLSFNEIVTLQPGDVVKIQVSRMRRDANNTAVLNIASINFSID